MQESEMFWSVVLSIVAVCFGVGGIFRGWQMGFRGRLDLVSDTDYRPLPDPAGSAKALARLYIGLGCVMLVLPLLLLAGVKLLVLGGAFGLVIWYWFYAVDTLAERVRTGAK
ncbi:MAG: hypothetical protein HYU78_06285 [Rhodocyclales bacterium]|nr:hypothetical protein [Rhodocyclales bacterium]